jgi:hypothetical protein
MRNKFMTIIPFVLLFAMTCYGQGLYVTDLETTDDVTVGDDLTVTDDAAIGGDVTITGSLTAGSIVGSAATAFDDIGDPDGNGAVDFTDYYQTYDFGDTDHDMMTWWFTGAFGDVSGFVLEQKTGNPTNGTLFEMKLADTDVDFMSLYQGSEVLNIDSSGNITAAGTLDLTGLLTASGGMDLTGNSTIGDGTGTLAINTSSWDISSAGALSGVTGLSFTGDITLANGYALNCGTTTSSHVVYLDVYDNDTGPAWVHGLSLTNGNTPAVAIGNGAMTVAVDSATWDVSTAGAFTGVTGLTVTTGNHITVGTTQWDDGSDKVNGEYIADDTIDDDSIDFTDVTGADLTLNDITTAVKTTSTFECDGAANISDTTAGADVLMGNSTGNLTFISDNVDFTLTDTTDNAFQLVNSNTAVIFDVDLGATDTVTIGSGAEAIVLATTNLDVAANGDVTATGSITGDGGDEVVGFLKLVTADTDDQELTAANSGSVWTNSGAIAAQTFTLPAAAAGLEFTFIVMAAQELRVDPAAGDVVYINAVGASAAEYWVADAVGESLHLVAVDGTNWIATSHIGTWTQETP